MGSRRGVSLDLFHPGRRSSDLHDAWPQTPPTARPFFLAQPDHMFAIDRFHPSGADYRRTAKAMLPSVLAALGYGDRLPHGHYADPAPVTSRSDSR